MSPYDRFARQLHQLLRRSPRVLLTITQDPDGDSVGSMLAMGHAVKHYGQEYVCFSPDRIPDMFHYLQGPHRILSEMPDRVADYDLVIIFDTGDMKRTPLVEQLAQRDPSKTAVVNIDHHPTVTDWKGRSIVDHNFVDTDAGATTEMLYKLLSAMDVPLNQHAATSLLTGILTDTGHFSNLGTSLDSLDIAATLMARGAQHETITQATMRNKSLGTLQLWGRALSRLKVDPETGIVSTVLTIQDFHECGVDAKASTGISNFLNNLGEGKIAMVLHEEPGGIIKGSLRTTKSDVNVADLAARFGGGGHTKAAGFKIRGRLVATKTGWRIEPAVKAEPVSE